ncbi:MAG: hypothetical protein ACQETR_01520 [Thermodesulfobacteriota bacterium]
MKPFFSKCSNSKACTALKNYREKGYEIIRKTINNPFPTRTWIALSVCVPLVPIFFIVFLIPAFEGLFGIKKSKWEPSLCLRLFFWMVPDLLIAVGRISVHTILQLKWIIPAIVVVGGIILIVGLKLEINIEYPFSFFRCLVVITINNSLGF